MAEDVPTIVEQERLEEEKAHRIKGKVKEDILARKREYKCAFCNEKGGAEIDDTDMVVCFHCLALLNLHREALKKFLR